MNSNLEILRNKLINNELKWNGVHDKIVLKAFGQVPRHDFVEPRLQLIAYEDKPLPIGEGQTISQPSVVGIMTQALVNDRSSLKNMKILELGTGSGYQTAILSEIFGCVCTIERIASLSERAQKILKKLKYSNIEFKIGDGTLGWKEKEKFDGIIITAAAPYVSLDLIDQLADEGRIVLPVGEMEYQELYLFIKRDNNIFPKKLMDVKFVPLIGKFGWSENR